MYIDSHCHLDHKRFLNHGGAGEIVARAREAGVEAMLSINCRISDEFDDLLAMVMSLENVWCTVGTHPHEPGDPAEQAVTVEEIVAKAHSHDKVIGIGESGLDYFYTHSPVDAQKESFRKHIRACLTADLPLIVHARDADADIMQILWEEAGRGNEKGLTGIMHCFSSGAEMAQQAVEFGFYMSFSGIVTFKKADELRAIASKVPLDKLLIETDAPFLTPEPHRKEMNEPKYVGHTCAVLAGLHNLSNEEMAARTRENFFHLFRKAA